MRQFIILLLVILAACNNDDGLKYKDLPTGDAARGGVLFSQPNNGAAACSSCHYADSGNAPDLADYHERAGKNDESAEEYTLNSITKPASHIVDGYSNLMPRDYGEKLTEQQIADLIAYLLKK